MSAAVQRIAPDQRHTRQNPCPICGGGEDAPRGQGVRCAGYTFHDGAAAVCSREEHAGSLPLVERLSPPAYIHRLIGPCGCGQRHSAPSHAKPIDRWSYQQAYDYRDAEGETTERRVERG